MWQFTKKNWVISITPGCLPTHSFSTTDIKLLLLFLDSGWGSVRTPPEKFERTALFLPLGHTNPSHWSGKKAKIFENALQNGGIWKRRLNSFSCRDRKTFWKRSFSKTMYVTDSHVTFPDRESSSNTNPKWLVLFRWGTPIQKVPGYSCEILKRTPKEPLKALRDTISSLVNFMWDRVLSKNVIWYVVRVKPPFSNSSGFAILRIFEQNWESNSLCEQAPGKGEKN